MILASQSPRRKQLLDWAEMEFDVIVSNSDESFPSDLAFDEAAIHIAKNKARAVKALQQESDRIILAADTIVVCDNLILGKPKDRSEAISFLTHLSGNMHQVITGVYLLKGETELSFADTTTVVFHELSEEQIEFYVDKYQPYDKAGAYAIQEWIGVVGIKSIDGDFYNVMGLPVSRVVKAIEELALK